MSGTGKHTVNELLTFLVPHWLHMLIEDLSNKRKL